MRALPLYTDTQSVIETTKPKNINPQCTDCQLHESGFVKNRCIPAWAGKPDDDYTGAVLIVGEGPGQVENATGLPFVGPSGKLLKSTVSRYYKGQVIYDNALRCFPGKRNLTEKHVEACRGYLAQTYRETKPSRVIALGSTAIWSLLGRTPPIMSVRRGYAWLGDGTPVFFVLHPAAALRNHFVRLWFEEDLQWALTVDPNTLYQPAWDSVAYYVDPENIQDIVSDLQDSDFVAYDTETSGAMFNPEFTLLCLSMGKRGAQDVYLWGREALENPKTRFPLIDLLTSSNVKKWGQNIKFDNLAVRCSLNIQVDGVIGDTRLFRRMQDSEATAKLDVLAELVGMGGHKEVMEKEVVEAVKKIRKAIKTGNHLPLKQFGRSDILVSATLEKVEAKDDPKRYAFGFVDERVLLPYNGRDTLATLRDAELLQSRMDKEPELKRTWEMIVLPATKAFEQMEYNGIAIDTDNLKMFSSLLAFEQMSVKQRLNQYVDHNFNWNSPKQLGELLFGKLKLPVVTITDTGKASTGEDALKTLEGRHPLIPDLMKFRKLEKLQSGYGQGLFKYIKADGRVHPTFNPDGAASGRSSCTDPNAQNIPNPSNDKEGAPAYGKMARDCYCAPPGAVLIQGDFSQLELRVACGLSQDDIMLEVFMAGPDFHLETAKLLAPLFGYKVEEITKKHWLRSAAKVINFALLYGKSDAGIAYDISLQLESGKTCTIQQASKIREAILGKFKKLNTWITESLSFARKNGYCWTWFDGQNARRRNLYHIADQDEGTRGNAERSSWNTRIQGTGSDFCMRSLSAVQDWLDSDKVPAKLVLTVHDSIMLEVTESHADYCAKELQRIMQQWPLNGVPVIVDIEIGRMWGSLQKVKDFSKPVLEYLL